MSGFTQTLEKPVTADTGNRTPPLKHLICTCQEVTDKGVARCGTRVAGPITYLRPSAQPPMSICVVCYELRDHHVPCQVCGKAP